MGVGFTDRHQQQCAVADRWAGRQAGRQAGMHACMHKHMIIYIQIQSRIVVAAKEAPLLREKERERERKTESDRERERAMWS